jgi:hypothetical protein
MAPRDWRRDRILDAWGQPGEPCRTLLVLDRLERLGLLSRVEHRSALQFHQVFAQVALAPLPAADPRSGCELGVLGYPIESAAEHVPAVNHIVRTLDHLAALNPCFARMAWNVLGLGRPPSGPARRLIATLRALRRIYGI